MLRDVNQHAHISRLSEPDAQPMADYLDIVCPKSHDPIAAKVKRRPIDF